MHILHCLLPELSPKCIHYPQNAYISIVFDEKYPLIAYIILDLELKYPLITYIILGLKKVQNIFKPRLPRIGAGKVLHWSVTDRKED